MARVKSARVAIALTAGLFAADAGAEDDPLGADEIAEAIVAMTTPTWTGPRTSEPLPTPRPREESITIRSGTALVAVHAPRGVDPVASSRALQALEYARSALDVMGWPAPLPDGDLGGGPELDLYFTPTGLPTGARSDGLAPWTYLDRASTFAVLDPRTPRRAIDACVVAAYAEALLLSLDPAEALAWRRATAAWLTWELTGFFGCEDAVWQQQAEPHRSWIRGGAAKGAGGAMLLAYLSSRHDGGALDFVRAVWALSSQRTWEGEGLRAEPDLWAAIETAVELSGDRLVDNVEDLAVLRWFVGRKTPSHGVFAAIDGDAQVPAIRHVKTLPARASARAPLQPFGSGYVLIDRPPTETRLRAWLRGEYGVRWSFIAVLLDEPGNELGRIIAPTTRATPKAYLPIDVVPRTARVLLVVTNLSSRLPDADEADRNERAFEIIVDGAGS